MSSGIKVKMSPAGSRQVMNSASVQALLLSKAQAAATRASAMTGEVFTADVQPGKTRAHAMAKTTDMASRAANARTNALLKGLG